MQLVDKNFATDSQWDKVTKMFSGFWNMIQMSGIMMLSFRFRNPLFKISNIIK